MTHSSRIEWSVLAAIALAIAAFFLGLSYWLAGPVLLVLFLCAYPQSYTTTAAGLEVRDALTRRVIPYAAIAAVAPRRGRVRVRHAMGTTVVSPRKRRLFIDDVEKWTPHLTRQDEQLVLRDRYVEYRVGDLDFIPG
jgi:hypothetical protein